MAVCANSECDREATGRGWCHKHYMRWWWKQDHQPRPKPLDRFWANIEVAGPLSWNGYGIFWYHGRRTRAHRFAYQLLVGPIPDDLPLDHVKARGCTSRACVNPAHLEPVTLAENILRGEGITAVNARKTHCIHGHPFSPENTRRERNGRKCRTCDRERTRRSRASRQPQIGTASDA